MLWSLYTAALGMLPQQTRLKILANNIANAETAGYKRIGTFQHAVIEAQQNLRNVPGQAEPEDNLINRYYDFTLGDARYTGNPLDLYLHTDGFFQVSDAEGNLFLTRSGRFTIDAEGYLRTVDGKYVMGRGGAIRVLSEIPEVRAGNTSEFSRRIRVTRYGEIYRGDTFIDALSIIKVENPQTLQRTSGVLFRPTANTQLYEVPNTDVQIRQGFIERSNVSLVDEMVQLITIHRAFELGQRVIRLNDATLGRSIEIARFL